LSSPPGSPLYGRLSKTPPPQPYIPILPHPMIPDFNPDKAFIKLSVMDAN
jgi:hypothetical protein